MTHLPFSHWHNVGCATPESLAIVFCAPYPSFLIKASTLVRTDLPICVGRHAVAVAATRA